LEAFVLLLRQHEVDVLADVRSAPYSRFSPQFNRKSLEQDLPAHGIRYVFFGRELGGRPDDPSCYEAGRVRYQHVAATESFRSGIERVLREADGCHVALMCAEREPLECHRTLLVSPALIERGVRVAHILGDGRVEAHEAAMERLLDIVGLPHQDLFRTRDELVTEALRRQEERVGYVEKTAAIETPGGTR
jgi:uncharacterized protein (DUF488 family)